MFLRLKIEEDGHESDRESLERLEKCMRDEAKEKRNRGTLLNMLANMAAQDNRGQYFTRLVNQIIRTLF